MLELEKTLRKQKRGLGMCVQDPAFHPRSPKQVSQNYKGLTEETLESQRFLRA
jgi:hypothetical protein